MSTRAKIGKTWVKCQLVLAETGETLHLTFAPGETRKKLVAHIDGRTDVGFIELKGMETAAPPYDAVLNLEFNGEGIRLMKPAAVAPPAPKPALPPKAAAVVTPPPAPAPAITPVAVPNVVSAVTPSEELPPPPEEIVIPMVQDSVADPTTAAGGKRGRKPTT